MSDPQITVVPAREYMVIRVSNSNKLTDTWELIPFKGLHLLKKNDAIVLLEKLIAEKTDPEVGFHLFEVKYQNFKAEITARVTFTDE